MSNKIKKVSNKIIETSPEALENLIFRSNWTPLKFGGVVNEAVSDE